MASKTQRLMWLVVVTSSFVFGSAGCGRAVDSQDQSSQDGVPVVGVAGFGTQCSLTGSRGDPTPVHLDSYGCTNTSNRLELSAPLLPIILQGDCTKKQVLAYSVDGMRIENRWNALPDGKFFFTMYAGNASFSKGPGGQTGCSSPVALEVAGLMNCSDRDHAELQIDATWHLNTVPPGTTPHLTGAECSVPSNCTFHAFTVVKQCS